MKSPFWALIPLALLITAGCSDEAVETADETAEVTTDNSETGDTGDSNTADAEEPAPSSAAGASADSKPVAQPSLPTGPAPTAEAAAQAVIDGVAAGNAGAVWAALPPRFQSDINELVQGFGNAMDPNMWGQIRGAVSKVHVVLSTKAEFLINSPMMQAAEDPDQVKAAIPQIAGLLKTILDSTKLPALKEFDGQAFFSGPASSLIAQMDSIAQLAPEGFSMATVMQNVNVETISSEGDTATLKFTNPDNEEETREVEFIRVDEYWLPADLAKDWDTQMEMARAQLATMPEQIQQQAPMVAMFSSMIGAALDPLAAAEDQEQFDRALEQVQSGMGGMIGPLLGGGAPGGPDITVETTTESESLEVEEEAPPAEE